MIKIENLTKAYKKEEVIKDFSLKVNKGEIISISGISGKTTLLNVIGLFDKVGANTYYFMDKDVSKFSDKNKNKIKNEEISYIVQTYRLLNCYTVYENVQIPLEIQKICKKEKQKRVKNILNILELEHIMYTKVKNLSESQKQKVAITKALITNPKLILADNPTSQLNDEDKKKVAKLFAKLNTEQQTTIIITSYDKSILQLCTKNINLNN